MRLNKRSLATGGQKVRIPHVQKTYREEQGADLPGASVAQHLAILYVSQNVAVLNRTLSERPSR